MIPIREDSNEILKVGWWEQGGQPRWNKVPAGLDENLSLEVRWRLSPKLSDGTDVADEKRRSALDGLKRLEKVYKSKALSRNGGARSKALDSWSAGSMKKPTSTIQVYIFWGMFLLIVASSLGSQRLKKPSTTLKWLIDVKIIEWR